MFTQNTVKNIKQSKHKYVYFLSNFKYEE